MKVEEYIKYYTKEQEPAPENLLPGCNGEEYNNIVSKYTGCYLTIKGNIKESWLIKFLAKNEILDVFSTFKTRGVGNYGYSEIDKKWYGWSHRAVYGFGIGDKVKKGDCAYQARNAKEYMEEAMNFWKDESHENLHIENVTDKGFRVAWIYAMDIPNKNMRGLPGGTDERFPKSYGRGEWEAKTDADAKQMAMDFANSVA